MLDISEVMLSVGLGAGGYSLFPDVWTRFVGSRVIRGFRGDPCKRMALTFDDGPDPLYTPAILDLLARYNARATFFLVGSKVRRYPDLTRRIAQQGHLIGAHTLSHRFAWWLGPATTVREVHDGIKAITEVLGQRPCWFRPPWGAHNAVTLWASSHAAQRTILWDVSLQDWRRRNDPTRMAARLVSKAHPGAVVLLHDSGGQSGAPLNTLAALSLALPELTRLGYQLTTVEAIMRPSQESRPPGHHNRPHKRRVRRPRARHRSIHP